MPNFAVNCVRNLINRINTETIDLNEFQVSLFSTLLEYAIVMGNYWTANVYAFIENVI